MKTIQETRFGPEKVSLGLSHLQAPPLDEDEDEEASEKPQRQVGGAKAPNVLRNEKLDPPDMVSPQERRAARASRDAMKQLHSESQRLVRGAYRHHHHHHPVSGLMSRTLTLFSSSESTLGLPYHIPQPKTIEQFFRRRARPQGPAMALLK